MDPGGSRTCTFRDAPADGYSSFMAGRGRGPGRGAVSGVTEGGADGRAPDAGGTQRRRRTLSYSPALDGLRAVAITMVVVLHLGGTHLGRGGWIGVNIFFVLSGFLITTLVINEADTSSNGRFSLGGFYLRRIFRLWPAYFVFIAVALVYAWIWQSAEFSAWLHQLFLSAVFYLNFYAISHPVISGIGPLWSLCVEEQFYIFWALGLLALCRWASRRTAMAVAAVGVVASTTVSLVLVADGASWQRLYYGLDSNAVSLLLGALVGLAYAEGYFAKVATARTALWGTLAFLAVTVAWFATVLNENIWAYAGPVQLFAVITACAVVLLVLVPETPVGRLLAWRPIVWIGRLSYSIYLWNKFAIYLFPQSGTSSQRDFHRLAGLVCLIAFSLASYYGVERWGLRIKNRLFEPRIRRPDRSGGGARAVET